MESAVQIAETTEVLPDRSGYISRKLKGEEKKERKGGKRAHQLTSRVKEGKRRRKKREGKKGEKNTT